MEFDLPCWKGHSNLCKDLLNKLLNKDPKIRITLDSALNHAWFKDVDFNDKTGMINKKNASTIFKQKKLNMTGNSDFKSAQKEREATT